MYSLICVRMSKNESGKLELEGREGGGVLINVHCHVENAFARNLR